LGLTRDAASAALFRCEGDFPRGNKGAGKGKWLACRIASRALASVSSRGKPKGAFGLFAAYSLRKVPGRPGQRRNGYGNVRKFRPKLRVDQAP